MMQLYRFIIKEMGKRVHIVNIKKMIQETIEEAGELKTLSYRNGMEILCVPHEVYVDRYEDEKGNVTKEYTTYLISGRASLVLSVIAEYMKENEIREFDYTLAHKEVGFMKKMESYLHKNGLN